ncbi:hypothetical protein CDAR_411721 [Caerostris darwini]|uniref:Uncharacterized protein n=1 Tax=Caerostris darwini TaxID=1538125 RepID=A0AAV4MJZ5_9ARAC|nr:hypothetical protein CDAR_411721 [Caerostris darwini]
MLCPSTAQEAVEESPAGDSAAEGLGASPTQQWSAVDFICEYRGFSIPICPYTMEIRNITLSSFFYFVFVNHGVPSSAHKAGEESPADDSTAEGLGASPPQQWSGVDFICEYRGPSIPVGHTQ